MGKCWRYFVIICADIVGVLFRRPSWVSCNDGPFVGMTTFWSRSKFVDVTVYIRTRRCGCRVRRVYFYSPACRRHVGVPWWSAVVVACSVGCQTRRKRGRKAGIVSASDGWVWMGGWVFAFGRLKGSSNYRMVTDEVWRSCYRCTPLTIWLPLCQQKNKHLPARKTWCKQN